MKRFLKRTIALPIVIILQFVDAVLWWPTGNTINWNGLLKFNKFADWVKK